MIEKKVFLTEEGLTKVEKELDNLKSVRRREIASEIQSALCCGDIAENAEYDRAKNEQSQLEERISKLEQVVSNARLIDEDSISAHIVGIGSKVIVKDLEYDEEMEYIIVGSVEADPFEGKISNESPLGKSLIGSKKGDTIEVEVPDGIAQYEILKIIK